MKGAIVLLLLIAASAGAAVTENIATSRDAAQSYTLILPEGYSTARKWPVLLLLDPRGRGTIAAELFRAAAEEYGWIVLSSNNTRSDTGWDVNVRALDALLPELAKYSTDPHRIHAAGFSGTASVAWMLAKSKNLAGVINSGQPYQDALDTTRVPFAVFSAAGNHDFNYRHARRIDGEVARSGQPHHLEIFDGAHEWLPAAVARLAIEWSELQAMRGGTRARDDAFIERLFENAMERAGRSKDELATLRRYESIQRDFEGMHDTTDAARFASALRDSARVRSLLKDERNADAYEKRELELMIARLRQVIAEAPPPAAAAKAMRIAALQRDAAGESYRGAAASRVIETLFVQTAFYLPQRYFESREFDKAAIVLAIATTLKPDRAHAQYDFARALARSGRKDAARAALERALRLGFKQVDPRTDPDLESLRDRLK